MDPERVREREREREKVVLLSCGQKVLLYALVTHCQKIIRRVSCKGPQECPQAHIIL